MRPSTQSFDANMSSARQLGAPALGKPGGSGKPLVSKEKVSCPWWMLRGPAVAGVPTCTAPGVSQRSQ